MLTIWGYTKGTDGRITTRRDTCEHVEVALELAREWVEGGLSVVTVTRDEGIGEAMLARMTALTPAPALTVVGPKVIEFPPHRAAAA